MMNKKKLLIWSLVLVGGYILIRNIHRNKAVHAEVEPLDEASANALGSDT
jgi:hypothetical protein